MKKIVIILTLLISPLLLKSAENEPTNFNKGKNFGECMINCRKHHQIDLGWERGEGQGICWQICSDKYPLAKVKAKKFATGARMRRDQLRSRIHHPNDMTTGRMMMTQTNRDY